MASPASRTPPCPHVLSAALLCAGVRRSPEQCRSKANLLLNGYIAARLQGRQSTGAFCDISEELEAVLDHEATQCVLQMGVVVELTGRACGASQASAPLEEEELATPGPPLLPELLLAGEAFGAEKGPGVRSEKPQRSPGGRGGDPAARPQCLRLPSSRRDQDPDCLITGLEIKPCERTACQSGGRTEAFWGGYRCVVHRTAYFAVKQKRAETAVRPPPWLAVPTPLLRAPLLHPPVAQCPPLPPTPEVCRLVPPPLPPTSPVPAQWGPPPPLHPPLSLAEPLLWVDSPGLASHTAHPVPALLPVLVTQVSLCRAPSGSANALPWQYQQAHAYVPSEPVGHWSSSHEPAPPGDSSPPVQLGPPPAAAAAAAALALLLTQGAPEPWETEEDPPEPPPAAEGSEPPSPGTPVSPLLPEAPRGSGLGLSAATLLSSLARLDPGEDLRVACPPGTPLQPLSPTRSADSGTPPSPQLQGLLSSSGLPSPSWLQPCPGDS